MTVQRVAFLSGVAINAVLLAANTLWTIASLVRGNHTGVNVSGAAAALAGITLWILHVGDRWAQATVATAESYLEEQKADTRLKQLMVEKFAAGEVTMSATAMPTFGRAH